MDILWAPWRHSYVESCSKRKKGCVFCRIYKEKKDKRNYIFLRTRHSFAVLNIYPFNGGHTLVIPNRHVDGLDKLSEAERKDLMDLLMRAQELLRKSFMPQAFNIGLNLGASAGAGIPRHLHWHIVPRWSGDVNFTLPLFDVKVIPFSLKKTYDRLVHAQKD
jgi:ATP adenylyltransferase